MQEESGLKGIRIATLTLGCKVNQYETEAIRELLEEAGAVLVGEDETADVCIVNTCSVTNMAERKSRQMLHRLKKQNPDSVVVAAGCYVQRVPEEVLTDLSVDLVVGNNCKKNIVEILTGNAKIREKSVLVNGESGKTHAKNLIDINASCEYEPLHIRRFVGRTREYIKIQDGCNQFCTYCIIPYVRGRIRSRKTEDILEEVKVLAESGCKEVVLTGIHVSSYGLDFAKEDENEVETEIADGTAPEKKPDNPYDSKKNRFDGRYLLDLIRKIAEIDGIARIRLSSLEPRIMSDEFVSELAKIDKLCPHFHLSLQSACNATLKRMNRKYTIEEYKDVVKRIRGAFDRPALTTDVIVGFPGETEEEFAETVRNLEELNLYQMHVFQYSKRNGTMAEKMQGQVPEPVKHKRSEVLLSLTKKQQEAFEAEFKGEEVEILVEEAVEKDGKPVYRGHTKQYIEVYTESKEDIRNQLICVKI